jgi:pantoate--beta-alanine ligase
MKIVTNPSEMRNLSLTYQKAGKTVGLVPTMGALHDGHISLLKTVRRLCDISVMSVYVNPVQFGPTEDLSKYPRPFDKDCEKAEQNGCDVVFAPTDNKMYPEEYSTFVDVEKVTNMLCGSSRPGHFKGVCTVVLKFLNIVSPQAAIFGQKDLQQCLVIKRMATDLNCPVKLLFAPTIREADGLALSSRNVYLTQKERSQAPIIQKGLLKALALYESGERNASRIRKSIAAEYDAADVFSIEYIEIVDIRRAVPVDTAGPEAAAAVAVRTTESKTRLIDNILLGGSL